MGDDMAKGTTTSKLAQKYGRKIGEAVRQSAEADTRYGIVDLPPGIARGVAKLEKCYFGEYQSGDNKGEMYFRAQGRVISPKEVEYAGQVVGVQGLTTSIMEPVCETTKANGDKVSEEEHIDRILNEMRKLGGPEFTKGAGVEDLEGLAADLQEAGPYFYFATTPRKDKDGKETGRAWENWNGSKGLENFTPEDWDDVQEHDDKPVTATKGAKGGGQYAAPEPKANGKPVAKKSAEPTLDEWVSLANDGKEHAVAELTNRAVGLGYTEEEVSESESWQQVADWIEAGPKADADEGGDDSDEGGDEAAEFVPSLKDVVGYMWKNPKTKRMQKVDAEVSALDKKKKTADLKCISPGIKETWKAVAWSDLITD